MIVDDLALSAIKTKDMAGVLKALKLREVPGPAPAVEPPPATPQAAEAPAPKKPKKKNLSLLIGTDELDMKVYKSARNIEASRCCRPRSSTPTSVLRPKRLRADAEAALEASCGQEGLSQAMQTTTAPAKYRRKNKLRFEQQAGASRTSTCGRTR